MREEDIGEDIGEEIGEEMERRWRGEAVCTGAHQRRRGGLPSGVVIGRAPGRVPEGNRSERPPPHSRAHSRAHSTCQPGCF